MSKAAGETHIGHLEEGSEVLYLAEIVLVEVNDLHIERVQDDTESYTSGKKNDLAQSSKVRFQPNARLLPAVVKQYMTINLERCTTMDKQQKKELVEKFKKLRVADVRDGMDWVGLHPIGSVAPEIRPIWRTKIVGFARTGSLY